MKSRNKKIESLVFNVVDYFPKFKIDSDLYKKYPEFVVKSCEDFTGWCIENDFREGNLIVHVFYGDFYPEISFFEADKS